MQSNGFMGLAVAALLVGVAVNAMMFFFDIRVEAVLNNNAASAVFEWMGML